MEAIEAGQEIEKIFLKKGMQGPHFREIFTLVRQRGIPFQFVPVEKLNRLMSGNHQGVIALLPVVEYLSVEALLPGLFEQGEVPFFVVLDRITDVRNVGAIARTAEAAGCHALIIPRKNGALINEDAVKTSAGALMHLPVCRVEDLAQTVRFLKDSGLMIIAATEKGKESFYLPAMANPLALVMGAEDTGIDPQILKISDHLVSIPMYGRVKSLNVSVAAGILMYEVVHRRREHA